MLPKVKRVFVISRDRKIPREFERVLLWGRGGIREGEGKLYKRHVVKAVLELLDSDAVYYEASDLALPIGKLLVYIAHVVRIPVLHFSDGAEIEVLYIPELPISNIGLPVVTAEKDLNNKNMYISGPISKNPHYREDFAHYERLVKRSYPWATPINPLSLKLPEAATDRSSGMIKFVWSECMRACMLKNRLRGLYRFHLDVRMFARLFLNPENFVYCKA